MATHYVTWADGLWANGLWADGLWLAGAAPPVPAVIVPPLVGGFGRDTSQTRDALLRRRQIEVRRRHIRRQNNALLQALALAASEEFEWAP